MNNPSVTKGDRITLPATPGTASVNPTMWPTGYRVRYGERSRFYLHAGDPVTVVDVRDDEVTVRHLPSKSTVLLHIDDFGHRCAECSQLGGINAHIDDPDGGVMWLCDTCHEAAVIAEEEEYNLRREEARSFDIAAMREDHEAMAFDAWYQEQKENRS